MPVTVCRHVQASSQHGPADVRASCPSSLRATSQACNDIYMMYEAGWGILNEILFTVLRL